MGLFSRVCSIKLMRLFCAVDTRGWIFGIDSSESLAVIEE